MLFWIGVALLLVAVTNMIYADLPKPRTYTEAQQQFAAAKAELRRNIQGF